MRPETLNSAEVFRATSWEVAWPAAIPALLTGSTSSQAKQLDGLGRRRDVLLGKHGTPESRAEYQRVLLEWEVNGRQLPAEPCKHPDITINEQLAAYCDHAEQHYRKPDGSPTSEIPCLRAALKPVKELYGFSAAKDFGALAMKAVRERMLRTTERRTGVAWSRKTVNQHVSRLRTLFKWAVEQELVPAIVLYSLQSVRGLQKGRSQARETAPIRSVGEAIVDDTLRRAPATVADMARLQLLTGMRPGEVCISL